MTTEVEPAQQLKPEKVSLQACVDALRRYPSISVFIVLGIIGFVLFQLLADQVFASASIDLKYPKAEILKMATAKLKNWGYESPDTKSEIEFGYDDVVKTFLEQSFGQEQANRLMSTVPMWYWQCTFTKNKEPTTKIELNPAGQLKRFDRTLPNDVRLPSLDRKAAQSLAMSFAKKESGIDLSHWNLIQSSDVSLQDRVDHTFRWADPATDYHGAQQRIEITISGDKVSEFLLYVHLADTWLNQYNIGRSYNTVFATVATSLYYLFILGAVVVFIRGIVKKTFSYTTALIFGAIYALGQVAKFANALFGAQFPNVFVVVGAWIYVFGASVVYGLGMAVLFAAAQPLYRELCPNRWPLKDWFTWKMLRSPELIQGIIVGFAVCFFEQGYQILYYFLGEHIGYWCPLSGGSYATLSRAFPFLDAFEVGISASFFEEILFRVIGLALLQKLFRGNFWIANLVQAAVWGFAHSNYPQQPAYARGVELTIEGLFNGWLIKRFGLIPNIVSHYLFDVIWTVSVLKGAPPSVAMTGLIPIAVPGFVLALSIAVASWKGLVYPPVITAEEARKTAEFLKLKATMGRPIGFLYNALSKRAIIVLVTLTLICSCIPFLWSLTGLSPVGSGLKPVQIKRAYAVEAATAYLSDLNISLDGCVTTPWLTVLGPDDAGRLRTGTFLRSQVGFNRTKELLEKLCYSRWEVTFQKQAEPVSYTVKFDQAGNFKSPSIVMSEDAPGATLTEGEARQVAEKFFAKHQSEWLPIVLLDSETSKKKNRTDYTFTFAVPKGKAGTADLLATIQVQGDMVSDLIMSFRIPDTWLKSHSDTPPNNADSALAAVSSNYLLIGLSLLLFFFLWREGHVRWKLAIASGIALAIVDILRWCNTLPWFYLRYDGNSPLPTYVTTTLLAWGTSAVQAAVIGTCCSALAFAIIHKYFKRTYLESAIALAFGVRDPDERSMQRRFWIDAILIASFVVLADRAFTAGAQTLQTMLPQPPIENLSYCISSANATSAVGRIIGAAVMTTLTYLYLAIVLPALTHKFLRGKRWIACILIFLWAICYFFQFGGDLVAFLTLLWFFAFVFTIFFVGRRNFLASALILLWTGLIPPILAISRLAFPLLIFDWCILLGLCLVPILWFIYLQVAPSADLAETPETETPETELRQTELPETEKPETEKPDREKPDREKPVIENE